MRSGYDNYDNIWGDEYYEGNFEAIFDRRFIQKTFAPKPALFSCDGHQSTEYFGQDFDKNTHLIKEGGWDHDHCTVCLSTIGSGHTYWENIKHEILCDACYEHYIIGK